MKRFIKVKFRDRFLRNKVRVKGFRREDAKIPSYLKRRRKSRMLEPAVRKFAKRQGLLPTKSLRKGGYGTYMRGDRYLTVGGGKVAVKTRRD